MKDFKGLITQPIIIVFLLYILSTGKKLYPYMLIHINVYNLRHMKGDIITMKFQ